MRPLIFGNGRMLVCEDERGIIRDIYYPYVGLENHCNLVRAGIYDLNQGSLSWFDGWRIEQQYKSVSEETLPCKASNIGETVFRNSRLGLKVTVWETVHPSVSYFYRVFEVENTSADMRNLRLFSNQNYSILENKIGETAVIDGDALVHYKRDRYILHGSSPLFDQFAVGIAQWHGLQGTWRDMEDGLLSGNTVAHGSVDSTLSWNISKVLPGERRRVHIWMALGKNYRGVIDRHRKIKEDQRGVVQGAVFRQSLSFWNSFNERVTTLPVCRDLCSLPENVRTAFYRSLIAIVAHMDMGGSVIASCDSDIKQFGADLYTYCWPRDAAWACIALDRARYHHLSSEVFGFLSRVITGRGCFLHKYTPAGDFGSTWHPVPMVQIDETGLVLFALYHNWLVSRDVWITGRYFSSLVAPAADYLARSIDGESGLPKSSFDLWEERKGVHTYSACAVFAGLDGASKLAATLGNYDECKRWATAAKAVKDALPRMYGDDVGSFRRSVNDPTIDASAFAVWYFGLLPVEDHRVVNTMNAVERDLMRPSGGVARYMHDSYQGYMNGWIICTLWLAQWHIASGNLSRALDLISWCARHSHATGLMPEQIADDGEFRSVLPLMWSHSAFVLAVLEYLESLADDRMKE